eukprot:TRINITY_DN5390_c0_g1_i2.p1 TRINITY_DN5390_c0_g1~~TRINITY_DN5390_c0_g1_i2.p1  ORF type:complete len:239 (-),score=3.60 TRINITY_DN5390_c0_g1_i2:529-1209(-)
MLEWRAAVSALCVALSCGGVAWAAAHPTHAWQAAPVAAAPRVAQQQLGRWPDPRLRHTNRVEPIVVPEVRRAALSPAALSRFPSIPLATRSPWLTLLAPLVAAGMWLTAFLRGRRGERPAVFAVPGTRVARWLDACDTLTEGFTPTWWCTNPHWQTIVGALIRGKPKVPYHRELLGILWGPVCKFVARPTPIVSTTSECSAKYRGYRLQTGRSLHHRSVSSPSCFH